MKRIHAMPFGAHYTPAATRFGFWAPGCARVALRLGQGQSTRSIDMHHNKNRTAGDRS